MASGNDGNSSFANGTRYTSFKTSQELEKHDTNAAKHQEYAAKQSSAVLEERNTLLELYSLEQLCETFLFEEMNEPSPLQQNLGEGKNELWLQTEQRRGSQNMLGQQWQECSFQPNDDLCWTQQEPQGGEDAFRTLENLRPGLVLRENEGSSPKDCFEKRSHNNNSFLKNSHEKHAKHGDDKQWSQCLYEQNNEHSASLTGSSGFEWSQAGEGRQYLNQQSNCEVNRKRKQCLFEQEEGVAQGKFMKQEKAAGTFLQDARGLQRHQDQGRFRRQWKQCLFQQEENNVAPSQECFQQEHEYDYFQSEQNIYSSQKQEGKTEQGWSQALFKQDNAAPDAEVNRQHIQTDSSCLQGEQITEGSQNEGSLTQQWQEYLFQSLDEVLNGQLRPLQDSNISTYKETQSVMKQQSGCEAEQGLYQSLSSYDRNGYIQNKVHQNIRHGLGQRY